jgi:hypothetical protein
MKNKLVIALGVLLVFGFVFIGCDNGGNLGGRLGGGDDDDDGSGSPTSLYISGIPSTMNWRSFRIRIGSSKGNYGVEEIDAENTGTITSTSSEIGGTLYVVETYYVTAYYGSGSFWIDVDIGSGGGIGIDYVSGRYVSKSQKNVSGETVIPFTEFEKATY